MDRERLRVSLLVLGAVLTVVGTIGGYMGHRNVGGSPMWARGLMVVGISVFFGARLGRSRPHRRAKGKLVRISLPPRTIVGRSRSPGF